MFTSTVSASMMSGVVHGHMEGMSSFDKTQTEDQVCEHAHSERSSAWHCHTEFHMDHSSSSDEPNGSDEMLMCSVCALCSSLIPVLEVDLVFIGRVTQGSTIEATANHSNFLTRLERPPRT